MLNIDTDIQKIEEEIIKIRRTLHMMPEASCEEFETTEFIYKYIEDLGLETQYAVDKTGVIGFLKVPNAESSVAFRADIDALSVEEKNEVEYKSKKEGYMHACGHDGHTAIVLGLAKIMTEKKETLRHNIVFIFQPAEEGPGGAEPIVNSGIFEKYNIKCIYGLHIYPELEEGKIGCRPGPMMAQTGEFDIKIIGLNSHGAMPQKGVDAIVAASNIVTAIQSIVSRNIDPIEAGLITIGRLVCGERRNVIANEALMEGTMRAFDKNVYSVLRSRLIKMVTTMAEAFNCGVEYEIRDMYPAVVNDEHLHEKLKKAVSKENYIRLKPIALSEDFSYYQNKVPGLFFMLGSRNESKGYVFPLHSNSFNFTESILVTGVQTFYNLYLLTE